MRVAIFTTTFYPSTHGISRVIDENIKFLEDMYDIEFEIHTPTVGRNKYRRNILINRYRKKFGIEKYKISFQMIRLMKNIDIIHAHHYGYWTPFAATINSYISKKPLVFTPHYHPYDRGALSYIMHKMYYLSQGYWIIKKSDFILPISKYEKKMLVKMNAQSHKTRVVPNPVNTRFFVPLPGKFHYKNNILFVSPLEKHKGAHIVFNIFKDIVHHNEIDDNVNLIFVGHGSLKSMIISNARKYNLIHRLIFIDNVSDKKLRRLYSSSRLLVLPSQYEAFGMVLAEAMACGTPVVATKVGGIPEVVGNCGRLVDYGDWERMKKHIIDILNMSEDKYRKLSEKCRKRVVRKFDSRVVAKKLYKVYESLI